MKYLITGGCGFIGCNFADYLLMRGEEVIVLDSLSRKGASENLKFLEKKHPSIEFVQYDIRYDFDRICKVVEHVDVVFHLAAQVAVTTSVANPREDFEINALGTFNILEAVRTSKKKPIIIYSSTNKVYGGMEDIKIEQKKDNYQYKDLPEGISEKRGLDFHSPYGCSKGCADQYVRDYSRIYGLKTVVMRQSCIYGPRQFGIEDQGWVAWFTIAAMLNRKITIYGDGKQVRDVLFVKDLFEAWDLAVKNIEKCSGQVYNVGGGPKNTSSLLELIEMLEKTFNKKIKLEYSDWRPGDQPVFISNIEKIKKEISWQPNTNMKDGVTQLAKWVCENRELFYEF